MVAGELPPLELDELRPRDVFAVLNQCLQIAQTSVWPWHGVPVDDSRILVKRGEPLDNPNGVRLVAGLLVGKVQGVGKLVDQVGADRLGITKWDRMPCNLRVRPFLRDDYRQIILQSMLEEIPSQGLRMGRQPRLQLRECPQVGVRGKDNLEVVVNLV